MFVTYSMLAVPRRDEQLLKWCRGDEGDDDKFDGLICLDECHKCKTISLDGDGNANKGSSKAGESIYCYLIKVRHSWSCCIFNIIHFHSLCPNVATKVVELQKRLPRARVVYCSATSVSEPKNLGFMTRLNLWGPGTEHPNFHNWLNSMETLGTGAIELNAMYLKSIGALQARQLSYDTCDFALIDSVSNGSFSKVYKGATALWTKLLGEVLKIGSGKEKANFWAGKYHLILIQISAFTSISFVSC